MFKLIKHYTQYLRLIPRYDLTCLTLHIPLQIATAVISASIKNDGDRGWTSFVLLILELNLIVWVGYYSDRNAGNAVKELQVRAKLRSRKGAKN